MRYEVYDNERMICQNRWPKECERGRQEKYRVLLIFDQEELRKDIGDEAYVQGDAAAEAETATRAALHNWMDVVEDDNMPRVTRLLRLATTEVERVLHRLTRNVIFGHMSLDNTTRKKLEHVVEMRVAVTASETSMVHLLNLIHEYLIARVLREWAGKTSPAFAQYWAERVESLKEEIKSTGDLCENHKVKRKMWPAW